MNLPKVIKTQEDYEAALSAIEALMELDPSSGTPEADQLELLALLVEDLEDRTFPLDSPDPIAAIAFRMEQADLTPRDLVPHLGSRAKVSEVLAGKRPLTLAMIRALHMNLGIPAEALISKGESVPEGGGEIDWSRFPLKEMAARKWIVAGAADIRDRAEELIRGFLAPLGRAALEPALYRKSDHVRSARTMDDYALRAWTARVMLLSTEFVLPQYVEGSITSEFLNRLVRLSQAEDGPRAAQRLLAEHGIALVVEPHLPRTHLDGAAMINSVGHPVIGMTLRHDRLDNFWFTLLHELVHVARHLAGGVERFYDDLESDSGRDPREVEADTVAGDALIPEGRWRESIVRSYPVPETVVQFANDLGVHPAIIAGRIQHESKNFKLMHHLVGRGEVRKCFPEVAFN